MKAKLGSALNAVEKWRKDSFLLSGFRGLIKKPNARQQELIVHGFSFNTPAEAYRCKTCKLALFDYGPKEFTPSDTPKNFLKKCVGCGEMIPIASDYCPKCGTSQKEKEE